VSEVIEKLRPDRDLHCYFFQPSAIAALSSASANGYTVSGSWRQQFDWTVIEWNRDNDFEHPSLLPLPDGDLSGLTLSYEETRTNCIAMESTLFPTVDWPFLRIWADDANGAEQIYRVRLQDHATPIEGSFESAQATFTLGGTLTAGDRVALSWRDEQYNHQVQIGDTFADVLAALTSAINTFSATMSAHYEAVAQTITLTNLNPGEEGNRLGIVGGVSEAMTEQWTPAAQTMNGGVSPSKWRVVLDFSDLIDAALGPIPTTNIRKMRWTYSAAIQTGAFERSDFEVVVSNWTVTGGNRIYSVAGPSSRRFEDDGPGFSYSGSWFLERGNYSGGTIHATSEQDASFTASYSHQANHRLYMGVRRTYESGSIAVSVDGAPERTIHLLVPGEDFLARIDLGEYGPGEHQVNARLLTEGWAFRFDHLEAAIPTTAVPTYPPNEIETLATDWDTEHSVVLAPERVVWILDRLGFRGRANHYVGAILFYELVNPGNVYAEATVTFSGSPVFSQNVQIVIDSTVFQRLSLLTDTPETIAKSFEHLINDGATGVRASTDGNVLTITARTLGTAGNAITLTATPGEGSFQAVASGATLEGGIDGEWLTDLTALPRHNRAARDWHRSYFTALKEAGIDCTAAFSTELSHGDPSVAAGIAQRYPHGTAVFLNTPAIQTNFSPTAIAYWKQVYLEMAQLQHDSGLTPYLQFGEVQWWYFQERPEPGQEPRPGMTFYDEYTVTRFEAEHGRSMHVFLSNADPIEGHEEEVEYLAALIGEYTAAIRAFVLAELPHTRFEVLYPHDVNDFPLTRAVNYPDSDWTPANYDVLKTENFTYTGERNLNKARESILFPGEKGFARERAAHLIGVFNSSEPWQLERRLSLRENLESVVFWAFDQFCFIGYRLPLRDGVRRARFHR
jgi:hypothetical protein